LTQTSWDGGKLTCRPLQKMTLHGISTQWNYDECMKNVNPPNASNVGEVPAFNYKWTEGGELSFLVTGPAVSNPTYELAGHTCKNTKVDSHYGLLFESDAACKAAVRPPNAESVETKHVHCADTCFWNAKYRPFAKSDAHLLPETTSDFKEKIEANSDFKLSSSNYQLSLAINSYGGGYSASEQQIREVSIIAAGEYQKLLDNNIIPPVCDWFKQDSEGPFSCTKVPSGDLPTTKDEAIAYYKKNYNADAICAPLKDNAPFQCTGTEQKSYLEIISLSYANAQLICGLVGSGIVFILYKCKRAKDPDALDEDALMKRLDALEANNKRMEANNKKLEANVQALEAWKALEKNQIATFNTNA
jgi:hypothetical protein